MPASRIRCGPKRRLLLLAAASVPLASAANNDYTLSTTELNRTSWERQPYVANGYIGQRIPAEGFGYREVVPTNASAHVGTQGWPLFTPRQTAAIVAGFYDQQCVPLSPSIQVLNRLTLRPLYQKRDCWHQLCASRLTKKAGDALLTRRASPGPNRRRAAHLDFADVRLALPDHQQPDVLYPHARLADR